MKITSKIILMAGMILASLGFSSCEKKQVLKLYSWTYYTPTDVVADFEKESGSKVFYNMPNVDDKIDDNVVIKKLLKELGFTRIDDHDSKGFSLFR